MKEYSQTTGVKKWAGDELVELQHEPLYVLQRFFEECGMCVVQGCNVLPAGNLYNVLPGVVVLAGLDAHGKDTVKAVRFAGAENVSLPIYLTLSCNIEEEAYGDGKVKPFAYNYIATASAVKPAEGIPFLEIGTTGGRKFVDAVKITEKLDKIGNGKDVTVTFAEAAARENVATGEKLSMLFGKVRKFFADLKTVAFTGKAEDLTQDANNRLVTDAEKAGWNDKYTKVQTYTRTEVDNKDTAALQAAKDYTAQKIAEVVNSAPGTLDTLQELATALGNDPNFATSIMALIGGKADLVHQHTKAQISDFPISMPANGGNADSVGNVGLDGLGRAYSGSYSFGGDSTDITTAEFVAMLSSLGAFNSSCWCARGSWSYANNKVIYDTGIGRIHLAGCVVETMGIIDNYTIRITTSPTSGNGTCEHNRVFIYTNNGQTYNPGWVKLARVDEIPTSLPANGGNADTAASIDNPGNFTLASALESNAITVTETQADNRGPTKLIDFHWYNTKWSIGNIRGGSTDSVGFGLYFNGVEKYLFQEGGRFQSIAGTFALTSEIPTSLPADGGTSDKTFFLQRSTGDRANYGDGTVMYQASDLDDSPIPNAWFSYLRILHDNFHGFFNELAFNFTGEERRPFVRHMVSGTLSGWDKLAFVSDIPAINSPTTVCMGEIDENSRILNYWGEGRVNGYPFRCDQIDIGQYRITHNLNLENYITLASITRIGPLIISVGSKSKNYVDIHVKVISNGMVNTWSSPFSFIILKTA